jgi:hypothetical protein
MSGCELETPIVRASHFSFRLLRNPGIGERDSPDTIAALLYAR